METDNSNYSKHLAIKCLRGEGECSCVLCEQGTVDAIAIPPLQEKFNRLLSTKDPVFIKEIELRCYLLAALQAMQVKDYKAAATYFQYFEMPCSNGYYLKVRPFLYYYKALIAYSGQWYQGAAEAFSAYLENGAKQGDEIAYFHLGNCFFRQQKWEDALEAYEKALAMRQDFREALINIGLVARKLGDEETARGMAQDAEVFRGIFMRGTLCENPLEYSLTIPENLSIWDIPIFINSRDRLDSLRKLLDWLKTAGYRRVYILDNDSTYPPLLEYYRNLDESEPTVQVLRLKKNIGHTALWDSKILEALHVDTPYVYTDSDVVPSEECPSDILSDLLQILRKYPFLKKAGLGLKTDDITYFDAEKTIADEKPFYMHEMEPELYFGTLDTTFALYRNYRHYNLYVAARTTGKRMAHHLPWYYDYDNLPEDERYYIEHANQSATLVQRMRELATKDS